MTNRYYYIIFLLLLILGSCDDYDISSLQSESFVKYYDFNHINYGAGVCLTKNGGYAILGNTKTPARGTEICLLITDKYGNAKQKVKYYGKYLNDEANYLKSLPDGGFLIAGSTQDTLRGDLDILIIRTNESGDTLWTRTFNGNDADDEAYYCELNSNNEIIITGYTTINHLANGETVTSKQIWLNAIDLAGKSIWLFPKTFGGKNEDEGFCVKEVSDGYLVTGRTKSYAGSTFFHSFIMKTSHSGSLINIVPFGGNADEEGNCLSIINDTTYLMCGTTYINTSGGSDIFLYTIKWKAKKSSYYIETTQKFGNSYNDKAKSMILNGETVSVLGTFSTASNATVIAIIKTDINGMAGAKIKHIGGYSQMEGQSLNISEDGGYIISGTNQRGSNSSIVMIKTMPDGNL
jgi:hypothetical protein